jgi:hypothetical protein
MNFVSDKHDLFINGGIEQVIAPKRETATFLKSLRGLF